MLPEFLKPFLWWCDLEKLDLERHKVRIITQILNYGTKDAVDWLFRTYSLEEIREVVKNPRPGEWDRKSLNFWRIMLDIPDKSAPKRRIL